jgi:hypothetical protein
LLYLIATIPWALTVFALLFIIFKNKSIEKDDDQEENIDVEGDYQLIHVAVYNDKAYWVSDNVFYESEIIKEPDFTTAHPIDTMNISPKKLNELLAILDELKEYRKE